MAVVDADGAAHPSAPGPPADLVPVFLAEGVRYFEHINNDQADLERVEVVEGEGVTHLLYQVHCR